MALQFAPHGDLYRLVDANERLSDNLVKHLFLQLLQGLHELHRRGGVVHRDIKPENLLVDHELRLVIADFNFAERLE